MVPTETGAADTGLNEAGKALLATAEAHHRTVAEQGKGSATDAIAAGRALIQAKEVTPRKGWLTALKNSTSITPRSCQRYMLLARVNDAGMLEQPVDEASFTEAYRLAVRATTKLARASRKKSADAPAEPEVVDEKMKETQDQAFKAFRKAARHAVNLGIPFKKLDRELAQTAGTKLVEGMATH